MKKGIRDQQLSLWRNCEGKVRLCGNYYMLHYGVVPGVYLEIALFGFYDIIHLRWLLNVTFIYIEHFLFRHSWNCKHTLEIVLWKNGSYIVNWNNHYLIMAYWITLIIVLNVKIIIIKLFATTSLRSCQTRNIMISIAFAENNGNRFCPKLFYTLRFKDLRT